MRKATNDKNTEASFSRKGPGMYETTDFVGVSAEAHELREQLQWIANEIGVKCILITGETGVGKDLAAQILHSLSVNVRDKNNFVHVNCGELTPEQVRSELFGHRKNCYTDGSYERLGCFRAAKDGTVFLNEIGNITPEIQSKLLHVLDENKVKPLGYDNEFEVNPLIILATNANLEQMVADGQFREDLLQRMQSCQINIPPLRKRKEDIPLLADFLYRNICLKSQSGIKPVIDKGVYALLTGSELKGNMRKLDNMLFEAYRCMSSKHEVVLRPSHFCSNDQSKSVDNKDVMLTEECLCESFKQQMRLYLGQKKLLNENNSPNKNSPYFDFPKFIHDIEDIFLQDADGKKARAANNMGISRKHFYRKK
jgi:DNA-binding NtrC family response regulator